MSQDRSQHLSRRRVFAGAGGVGALAAAAAVLPLKPTLPAAAAVGAPAGLDDDGRYQLTQHVQRYYQTAKV